MIFKKGTFSIFPCNMCKGLHPYQQVIMAWLCKHANDEGVCFPSLTTLARECGISKDAVIKHIKLLIDLGYLMKDRRSDANGNMSNLYHIILKDPSCSEQPPLVAENYHPSCSEQPPLVAENDTNYIHNNYNHLTKSNKSILSHECNDALIDNNISNNCKIKKLTEYSPEFEIFWSLYPKRLGGSGKHSAHKAWKARLKDGEKINEILDGVKRYQIYCKATNKENTEYVKMASTFLSKDKFWLKSWEITNEQQRVTAGRKSEWQQRKEFNDEIDELLGDEPIRLR